MSFKEKKNSYFLLKIFIFLLVLCTLFVSSVYIIVYNSPFIFKKFLNRNLTFKSIHFSFLKAKLEIDNLSLSNDKELLFSLDKMIVDISVIKSIEYKPTISYIYLENPVTFIEKDNDFIYKFPEYINYFQSKTGFSVPFLIEHIEIKNGTLNLKENNKYSPFITDISIFLPGIDFSNTQKELFPQISGKIGGKLINLKGKTSYDKNRLINQFELNLNKFDLKDIIQFIPEFNNIKLISGIMNASIKIDYITSTNYKPKLIVSGDLSLLNCTMLDINKNSSFINNLNIDSKNIILDVFEQYLSTKLITISNGNIFLDLKNELFTVMKKNIKEFDLRLNNKNIEFKNLNFFLSDKTRDKQYLINDINFSIKNLSTNNQNQIIFNFYSRVNNPEKFIFDGVVDTKNKTFLLKNCEIDKFDPVKYSFITDKFIELENCNVDNFKGNILLKGNYFKISGISNISNLIISVNKDENKFNFKRIELNIENLDSEVKILSLKSLNVIDSQISLQNNSYIIKNLNFQLKEILPNYTFQILKESEDEVLQLKNQITLSDISGFIDINENDLNFMSKNIVFSPDIKINISRNKVFGNSDVEINEFELLNKEEPVFKIENGQFVIDKIDYPPFNINVKKIDINSQYASLVIKENNSIYLFSVIPLLKSFIEEKKAYIAGLNLDSAKIKISKMSIMDMSTKNIFVLNISKIKCDITNYPSNINPDGNFNFSGIINERNPIEINARIGNETGFKGIFKTKDFLLPQLTQYSEKYLGYYSKNGSADVEAPFDVSLNGINIDINLKLKNFRLQKKGKLKPFEIDISQIIPKIEDDQGIIFLNIPIKGNVGKTDLDLKKMFFEILKNTLSANTPKVFSIKFTNFFPDLTYDIIPFKDGTDEFLADKEIIFSKNMIENFKNSNKSFVIEGLVDKDKDSHGLKEKILTDKIILFNNKLPESGSIEEYEILKKIYFSITKEKSLQLISNEKLKEIILQKIILQDSNFFALSYSRVNKIKQIMMDSYDVGPSRIDTSEKDIYNNRFIKVNNKTIAIIISGKKN